MNYLTQHLLEAIEINQKRKPLYAKLSKGRSLKISRTLLFFEKLSLVSSYPLDNIAKYWQKRNVPVMVHEFIPMDQTPDFKEKFSDQQGILEALPNLDTKKVQTESEAYFKRLDYGGLFDFMDKIIEETSEYPKHMCMVRHILESIRRSAYLTEMHIKRADEINVRSPEKFCRYLLMNQIKIIHSSKLFDKWAHPLQKDGIPIIYQDVPYIPAKPETYLV
jgi:hypothetical protein